MVDFCTNIIYVFPAHAGVILSQNLTQLGYDCFPRTRGGDPSAFAGDYQNLGFSPHTRG